MKLLITISAHGLYKDASINLPTPDWFTDYVMSRDTSATFCDFLGFSAGIEMLEMFLLSRTMCVNIRVVRHLQLEDVDAIANYAADDSDLNVIMLITVDDTHYNVLL